MGRALGLVRSDIVKKATGLGAGVGREEKTLSARAGLDELDALRHAEYERSGREDTGLEAGAGEDGGLRAAVGYGPTGARVDDVAVAFSTDDEAAQIISGGGDALTGDADAAGGGAGAARIFETNVPGGTTGRSAEGAEVVAKINERAGDAVVERELRDDIDGVFFAEPTEVEGHAGSGKKDAAGSALHFFPADERTGGGDLGEGRDAR